MPTLRVWTMIILLPMSLLKLRRLENLTLFDPFILIRRGTAIGTGCTLRRDACIEGQRVSLGEDVILDGRILGNDVSLGRGCRLTGIVSVDKTSIGHDNEIDSITGDNNGAVIIGNYNLIDRIHVDNKLGNRIAIGNRNELHRGLCLNAPFPDGNILIGHNNSLGRDGGSVASTSYRFNRSQGGMLIVGSNVEITRGAEVLGFSVLGVTIPTMELLTGLRQDELVRLFVSGTLTELAKVVAPISLRDPNDVALSSGSDDDANLIGIRQEFQKVSLLGGAKVRRSFLGPRTSVRDKTRVTRSFLCAIDLMERGNVVAAYKTSDGRIQAAISERALEGQVQVTCDWENLLRTPIEPEFPDSDFAYYSEDVSAPIPVA